MTKSEEMEQLLAQYLRQKGYQVSHPSSVKTEQPPRSLQDYTASLGLSTDDSVANHLLFDNVTSSSPEAIVVSYQNMVNWIESSLDMYKFELHALSFPLFTHVYLDLMAAGHVDQAHAFFRQFSSEHKALHFAELQQLSLVTSPSHLDSNEYVQQVFRDKFPIYLSMLSFQLLQHFLRQGEGFSMLALLNARTRIIVKTHQPQLLLSQLEKDAVSEKDVQQEDSPRQVEDDKHASRQQTSEIISSGTIGTRETENGTTVATGEYSLAYMAHAVGSSGSSLEDMNSVFNVRWGVIPETQIPVPEDEDMEAGDGDKTDDGADKKAKEKVEAESSLKKRETGPVPDRKDAFNSEILEKLVLRQPPELKKKHFEDLRLRPSLDRSHLPSALHFTVLNTAVDNVNNVICSDDLALVASTHNDGSCRVWRQDANPLGTSAGSEGVSSTVSDEERHATLRGHSSSVFGASFSPDDRLLVTASGDGTCRMWSLAAKATVCVYRSHCSLPVWDVQFGPLGYYFASSGMDRTARLWSTDRLFPLRLYAGHLSDVNCSQFHPNQNYLATASDDKSVRLWDVQTGICLKAFTGHSDSVNSVAFSPDGKLLASAGQDKLVNVWDLRMNKKLATLIGHSDAVHDLSFSMESSLLASGGKDSTVRLWDVTKLQHHVFQPQVESNGWSQMKKRKVDKWVHPVATITEEMAKGLAPSSNYLLKTLKVKQTCVTSVMFTKRNLLATGGVLQPNVK